MLWDLVEQFMGSIPQEYDFLKIIGVIFILYILVMIFNLLWQGLLHFIKGL